MNAEKTLLSIRSTLEKVLPSGGRAILYGSRARGTARQDSDWDVLILIDKDRLEVSDYDEITYPLSELGWKLGTIISPVLYTEKDWQAQNFTPFYKNIESEGIPLA